MARTRSRALALITDYNILGLSLALFIFVYVSISARLIDIRLEIFITGFGLWMTAIAFLTLFLIYRGYFVFFENIWQGQTPVKRIAGIRVVRDDGRPLSLEKATLESLLHYIDESLFIGAILIMFNKSEKYLGDLVTATIVAQAQALAKSANLTISEEGKLSYMSLQKISDLSQLLPDDFSIVREYLQRLNIMSNEGRISLSLKLSEEVRSIINLPIMPADIPSDVFLEACLFSLSITRILVSNQKSGKWGE